MLCRFTAQTQHTRHGISIRSFDPLARKLSRQGHDPMQAPTGLALSDHRSFASRAHEPPALWNFATQARATGHAIENVEPTAADLG